LPWYNADIESNRRKKMKKYFGSDDGYDYSRDNRNGEVDIFLKSLEPYYAEKARKEKEEKESQKNISE
jgi:hypothetical protein